VKEASFREYERKTLIPLVDVAAVLEASGMKLASAIALIAS
jgi:hypothetical protein